VNCVDNSDSLCDGAYHSVRLNQNVARSHPLHENTCHVAGCSASSPNRSRLKPGRRSMTIWLTNLKRTYSHVDVELVPQSYSKSFPVLVKTHCPSFIPRKLRIRSANSLTPMQRPFVITTACRRGLLGTKFDSLRESRQQVFGRIRSDPVAQLDRALAF
jgi:hypothetical protein